MTKVELSSCPQLGWRGEKSILGGADAVLYYEDFPKRVRAVFNEEAIAESRRVKALHETVSNSENSRDQRDLLGRNH